MKNIKNVFKTCKDYDDNIIWQSLYINNIKVIENKTLNFNVAIKVFNISSDNVKKYIVYENDYAKLYLLFPYKDDFSELNDS